MSTIDLPFSQEHVARLLQSLLSSSLTPDLDCKDKECFSTAIKLQKEGLKWTSKLKKQLLTVWKSRRLDQWLIVSVSRKRSRDPQPEHEEQPDEKDKHSEKRRQVSSVTMSSRAFRGPLTCRVGDLVKVQDQDNETQYIVIDALYCHSQTREFTFTGTFVYLARDLPQHLLTSLEDGKYNLFRSTHPLPSHYQVSWILSILSDRSELHPLLIYDVEQECWKRDRPC